jgi:hypothetical protein
LALPEGSPAVVELIDPGRINQTEVFYELLELLELLELRERWLSHGLSPIFAVIAYSFFPSSSCTGRFPCSSEASEFHHRQPSAY